LQTDKNIERVQEHKKKEKKRKRKEKKGVNKV
jgi:hypothetical protein